jgi:hypothetical protein
VRAAGLRARSAWRFHSWQTVLNKETSTMFYRTYLSFRSSRFGLRRTPRKCAGERRLSVEPLEDRTLLSVTVLETEPNDTMLAANPVPLGFDAGEANVIAVKGDVPTFGDRDWYAVQLNAGDVFGATVQGQSKFDSTVSLRNADGNLMIFNADHRGVAYNQFLPAESPLPRLNATSSTYSDSAIYYVISRPGTYYVEVAGQDDASVGQYRMDLVVARPGLEAEPVGAKQIVFVDFDGATVNMSKFGYPGSSGNKTLSPMRDFLPRWGLSQDETTENAVIDAILANMEENLSQDVRLRGLNGDFAETGVPGQFDIEIRNSRDHADEFGTNPYVARVIIGGTEAEADLNTFGLAESTDVGNFKFDDDALVLLDRRSEPAGHPQSLNSVPIHRRSSMVELVGVGIGNLASHELGHNFGNFHTDRWNDVLDVMDQGGPRRIIDDVGAGRDGIFGTKDDIDRAFGVDDYCTVNALGYPEFFTGVEDTLNVIAFGLSTGKAGASSQAAILWPVAVDLLMAGQHAGQASVVPSSQESDTVFTVLVDSAGKPIYVGQSANTFKDDLFDVTSAKRSDDETAKRFADGDGIGQSLAAEENIFDPLGL